MTAREEKRAAFNELMNEWVSRQGIWFQLRHAADGQTLIARLMRVSLRLIIVVAVILAGGWFYLFKRVDSDGFKTNLEKDIAAFLKADEAELGAFKKTRDILTISSAKIQGDEGSFFHDCKAKNIRVDMRLTDGVFTDWQTSSINIGQANIEIKAGAGDDKAAADAFSSIFEEPDTFRYDRLNIDDVSIRWGYSQNNLGTIRNSTLSAVRNGDSWSLEFQGGRFTQNWIRDLEIKKLSAVCDQNGVHIKEAVLKSGDGLISFTADIAGGGKPSISGRIKINSASIRSFLPSSYQEWMDGTLSGEGTISGSTNSQEGIVLKIRFSLQDGDVLVMRDRLPLISALSVVDLYNGYRKVSYTEGGFTIRTGNDRMMLTDIDLRAGSLIHIKGGQLTVRPSNHEEITESLGLKDQSIVEEVMNNRWKFEDDDVSTKEMSATSLSMAARGVSKVTQLPQNDTPTSSSVLATSIINEGKVRRFEGAVSLGLKSDAFDKAIKLRAAYPVDPATGRIWVKVPLQGRVQTLTLEQAKRFYVLGKNRL